VVVASAILCHLPDPLEFLAYLSSLADQAIFFFGRMVDSDALLISYQPPHPSLRRARPFPHDFNENTRLSRGLFERSTKELGFREIVELPWRDSWLDPYVRDGGGPQERSDLATELANGSRHVAVLAMR
jgi:hypothetical protein